MKRTIMMCMLVCMFLFNTACENSDDSSSYSSSSSTVFKIILQPDLQPYTAYSGVSDTYISTANPTTNNSTATTFTVASRPSDKARALIKFDLKPLDPENVNVVKAYLTLRRSSISYTITPIIIAYRMTTDWYLSACWNYRSYDSSLSWSAYGAEGNYKTSAASNEVICNSYGSEVTLELDPGMIEEWLQDESINFGIMLKSKYEGSPDIISMTFCSSENSTLEARPKLTIYYTLP